MPLSGDIGSVVQWFASKVSRMRSSRADAANDSGALRGRAEVFRAVTVDDNHASSAISMYSVIVNLSGLL